MHTTYSLEYNGQKTNTRKVESAAFHQEERLTDQYDSAEGLAIAQRSVNLVIQGTRLEHWKIWVDQLLFLCFLFIYLFCHLLVQLISTCLKFPFP